MGVFFLRSKCAIQCCQTSNFYCSNGRNLEGKVCLQTSNVQCDANQAHQAQKKGSEVAIGIENKTMHQPIRGNHLLGWMGQRCTSAIDECHACMSSWRCIPWFHQHNGKQEKQAYIVGKLKEYIEEVGPSNVVQLCSDNASAMLRALDMVIEEYPHIYKRC